MFHFYHHQYFPNVSNVRRQNLVFIIVLWTIFTDSVECFNVWRSQLKQYPTFDRSKQRNDVGLGGGRGGIANVDTLYKHSGSACPSSSSSLLFLATSNDNFDERQAFTRRDIMTTIGFSVGGLLSGVGVVGGSQEFQAYSWAQDDESFVPSSDDSSTSRSKITKSSVRSETVLVLGGTGLIGSQVVQTLREKGISVVATSRDGRDGTFALDVTKDNFDETIQPLLTSSATTSTPVTAVISCIGSIGSTNDEIINGATGRIARIAKRMGVPRFVYITVAPEVKELAQDIDFLQAYMKGKSYSRAAVASAYGSDAYFIEPTFVYGGTTFSVSPPRVASIYGTFIEALLSSSVVRVVENLMPAGILKIALEPPVSVTDVANVASASALGLLSSSLSSSTTTTSTSIAFDTYDKIKEASAVYATF